MSFPTTLILPGLHDSGVELKGAGHIDSASGLGVWPAGHALLERLRAAESAAPTRA